MSGIENSNSDYLETTSENINNNENLRSSVDEVLKKSTDEEINLGVEAIKNLKSKQLAYYIESTFENQDGRADYQTMLTNPYYGFMVQAAIDLLSDKFNDSKFDKDGKQGDGEGYKSLDEWLQAGGGIDNNVGGKTKTAVRIVQNLLQIEVDGAAGPQFFAAVCAALKGENAPSNFKVRNKPNYTEKYNFNSSKQTVPISSEAGSESTATFIMPLGYKLGNLENNQIKILNTTGNETGAYLKREDDGSFVVGYVDGYVISEKGKFTINNDEIAYKGPAIVAQEAENLEAKMKDEITENLNKISGNYDLKAAVQDVKGNITYVTLGNGSLSVYNNFSGDRAKIDLNNSVVYKNYINSDFYKNIYNSIDVSGGNWLDDISHTKFEDIQPVLNDYPNRDGNFSTENYIDIGTRIPRHTRWYESYRQKLGSRFVGRNIGDGHPSGIDFVDWCNDMKNNGCANYGKLTISEWIAFNTKFSKESISKIYM